MPTPLTAILLDDEEDGLITLQEQIKMYCPHVNIIGTYDDALFGLEKILELKPDVAFLDIQMPQMSGLEVARQVIPEGIQVIFVTAHQEYSVDALRLTAHDYLLKPLQESEDLIDAVNRLETRKTSSQLGVIFQRLLENNALENYSQETEIALADDKVIIFPKVKDIIRMEAHGSCCKFILTNNKQFTVTKNLGSFMDSLKKYGVLRANRSEAVNMAHKTQVIRSGPYLVMSDGAKVSITDTYRSEFPF